MAWESCYSTGLLAIHMGPGVLEGPEEGEGEEAGSQKRPNPALDGQSHQAGKAAHSGSMNRSCWSLGRCRRAGALEKDYVDLWWSS